MKVLKSKFSKYSNSHIPTFGGFMVSIFVLVVLVLSNGCKKDPFCNCLNRTGSTATETRQFEAFNQLEIEKNVDVFLVQDSTCFVKVTCGKNLLDGISTEVSDGKLYITNNNRCNWSRSFKNEFIAEVHCPSLVHITYSTSGNLTSLNQFKVDSLFIISDVGTGSISLNLNANIFYGVLNTGLADLTVKGIVNNSYLLANGQGFIDTRELENGYVYVQSNASNDCKIRVSGYLDAEITSEGNIYYYGNPSVNLIKHTGTGQLIKAQ